MLKDWLKSIDYWLLLCVFGLVSIGLMALFSTSQSLAQTGNAANHFANQSLWFGIGLFAVLVCLFLPYRLIYQLSYVGYAIGIILLIGVLFYGTKGYGATRWLYFGPIGFQPSEIAKVATMLAIARFLADRRSVNNVQVIAIATAIILLPFGLIVKQPDLGTSLVFVVLLLPVLFWAGIRKEYLFFILAPVLSGFLSFNLFLFITGIVAFAIVLYYLRAPNLIKVLHLGINIAVGLLTPVLWSQLHDYQKQRILTFWNPEADPLGAGYQIIQSKVAIGSGGWFGTGLLQGSQTQLRFLPEQHTDFIFAVIGEELGFIGVVGALVLFGLLLVRMVQIANSVRSKFSSIAAIAIGTNIGFQMFVNVGMTIGLFPVTGLPLPFISYGGTALLINMTMIGILLNFFRHKYEY